MAVGYLYDPIFLKHETGVHPERKQRLEHAMRHLAACGLLERLVALPSEPASLEDIARVHVPTMIEELRDLAQSGGGSIGPDTVVSPDSFEAALAAAGASIAAVRHVLEGTVESAFALVRPPGHHATPSAAMGFCLFNNIAIAATWALAERGLRRIAIVDFDVHHGNGTETVFRPDPRVLYISTHQYPFYPGTGHWRQAGVQVGIPNIMDIPLPAGTGDVGYYDVFTRLIQPALERFEPEIILVSAGYDAHWSDPLAWMLLSIKGFRQIMDILHASARALCDGRMALMLEGGYGIEAFKHCVATTFASLLDLPYDDPLGPAHESETDISAYVAQMQHWYGLA